MKKKFSVLLLVVAIVTLVSTISYAYWNLTFEQNEDNIVVTDCFKVTYGEDINSNIHLDRGYPILDEEGKKLVPYTFWMENICTSMAKYQINMESMESSTMPERVLKAMINDKEGVLLRESTEPTVGIRAFKVDEGYLHAGEKKRFEVRLWMDESTTMDDYDAMNKNYVGKVTVVASYQKNGFPYTEEILNGTDPVLSDGLIPVTIENDGTVKKADLNSAWYQYSEQEWANAVILLPENERTEENKGKVYEDLEVIPENDIESYFVWIPRYQYKIWNMGKYNSLTTVDYNQVHVIDVIFGTDTTTDTETTCASPLISGSDGTCSIGKYMTHPAFISFDTESSITKGMWVGKFETGYKGAKTASEAQKNENNPGKVQIKPDVYSWHGVQASKPYLTSYNYKREYDSHMMKSTEWGAVAYLQHSKYGSHESVRSNNNSAYLTGYAAVNEPTTSMKMQSCASKPLECNEYGTDASITQPWNTSIGIKASTTGNISGIYDMSGGTMEYVMGVMLSSDDQTLCSGQDAIKNSGFNGPYCNVGETESKTDGIPFPTDGRYYDIYNYATLTSKYERRILGDAIGEMGPFQISAYNWISDKQQRQLSSWYNDESWFIYSYAPWFVRGGNYSQGNITGMFSSYITYGHSDSVYGFRIVLMPQEV